MSPPSTKRRAFGPPAPPRRRRKSFFVRGIVTILPVALTIFILVSVVRFAQDYVTSPINSTIYWALESNGLGWKLLRVLGVDPESNEFLLSDALPPELQRMLEVDGPEAMRFETDLAIHRALHKTFLRDLRGLAIDPDKLRRAVRRTVHPVIGAVVSLVLLLTLGYLASGYLGRRLVSGVDRALLQLPVVRSIYPYTKQVVEFFLAEKDLDLGTVVAAPYPSEGLWSLGFVTSAGLKSVHEKAGGKFVSVYIASSPVPMTGYTIFIEIERLIPLDISIDDALRTVVSVGVLIPPQEKVEGLEEEMHQRLGKNPTPPAPKPG